SLGQRRVSHRASLKMFAKGPEARQDEKAADPAAHFVVLERPRRVMRNEHSVQPRLERGIDIAARTIPDHPSAGFHDVMPVHESAVSGYIFFGNDLDRVEMNLQPRSLDLRGLLGRFAFGEKNQPV